jgi:hypothetical protein
VATALARAALRAADGGLRRPEKKFSPGAAISRRNSRFARNRADLASSGDRLRHRTIRASRQQKTRVVADAGVFATSWRMRR